MDYLLEIELKNCRLTVDQVIDQLQSLGKNVAGE